MVHTVLVVDDEPTLRETLAEAFTQDGLHVVTASTGSEAIERFRDSAPDLVLLDLMLPEVSGIEVCRIIRRESTVPILMLTAKDSESTRSWASNWAPMTTSPALQSARADGPYPFAAATHRGSHAAAGPCRSW